MAIENGKNGRNGGWRKYFKVADTGGQLSPISGRNQFGLDGYPRQTGTGAAGANDGGNAMAFRNYASRLPEVWRTPEERQPVHCPLLERRCR
jgi:hypothetical protein